MTVDASPETTVPRLLAACWTWAGDAAPGHPADESAADVLARIESAAQAGWDGLGFNDHDLALVRGSIGFAALRKALDDRGIDLVEVEFLGDWWRGDGAQDLEALLLEAAHALGARLVKAGVPHREQLDDLGADVVLARLRALGDRAAQAGTRVALEAMGVPGALHITDVDGLLARADHPACGAVVDNFQLARVGTTREQLRELDWERVFSVELGDGIGAGFDIAERCLPGDGDIGLEAFIGDVAERGWGDCWGVEIISSQLRGLPQPEGVRRVRDGVLAAFARP
jgi:sugar phosphate isomerase/epimerase